MESNVTEQNSKPRYTVECVDNRAWGGVQWAIWDHELQTWADSLGRYLSEDAARRALPENAR